MRNPARSKCKLYATMIFGQSVWYVANNIANYTVVQAFIQYLQLSPYKAYP